jgi:hypothetical protein
MSATNNLFAKLGAIAYLLWGLLHLNAARLVWQASHSLDVGFIQGRVQQLSWDLLFFAIFSIVVAVTMNWKNSRCGYWLNLIIVSAADIGFVLFVLLPGHAPMNPAALGPILWVVAVVFSTLAYRQTSRQVE